MINISTEKNVVTHCFRKVVASVDKKKMFSFLKVVLTEE